MAVNKKFRLPHQRQLIYIYSPNSHQWAGAIFDRVMDKDKVTVTIHLAIHTITVAGASFLESAHPPKDNQTQQHDQHQQPQHQS